MTLAVTGAGTSSMVTVNPAMGDGRDAMLRLVYGADSVMSVFVNGQRVSQRRYAPTPEGRYHLMLMGHSVEAAVRIRRLRVRPLGAR